MIKRMFGRPLRRACLFRPCAGPRISSADWDGCGSSARAFPADCIDAVAATAILNTSLRLNFPSFDFATLLSPFCSAGLQAGTCWSGKMPG